VVQTRALAKILRDLAQALEACCPDGCRVSAGEAVCTPQRGRRGTSRKR
jgi:hypothetical protein